MSLIPAQNLRNSKKAIMKDLTKTNPYEDKYLINSTGHFKDCASPTRSFRSVDYNTLEKKDFSLVLKQSYQEFSYFREMYTDLFISQCPGLSSI